MAGCVFFVVWPSEQSPDLRLGSRGRSHHTTCDDAAHSLGISCVDLDLTLQSSVSLDTTFPYHTTVSTQHARCTWTEPKVRGHSDRRLLLSVFWLCGIVPQSSPRRTTSSCAWLRKDWHWRHHTSFSYRYTVRNTYRSCDCTEVGQRDSQVYSIITQYMFLNKGLTDTLQSRTWSRSLEIIPHHFCSISG